MRLFALLMLIGVMIPGKTSSAPETSSSNRYNTVSATPNFSFSEVRVPAVQPGSDRIYRYIITLLNLALVQTEGEYGLISLVDDHQPVPQSVQFQALQNDNLDITWSITSEQREKAFLPIRIPLIGGLFGYRVLLVDNTDARFSAPPSLDTLREMIAIQGDDWPDVTILESNHFNVATSSYENTFNFLNEGKADYFPRAAHEVFEEMETPLAIGLSVVPGIAIAYQNPMFFFVSTHRPDLFRRIEIGLTKIMKNGDLHRLLTAQLFYIQARNLLEKRTIYALKNPLLSELTQTVMARYSSPLNLIESNYQEAGFNVPEVQVPVGKQ